MELNIINKKLENMQNQKMTGAMIMNQPKPKQGQMGDPEKSNFKFTLKHPT